MNASGHDILACYGELADLAGRMLELARLKEWGALPALDSQCSALVERLKSMQPQQALHADDRARARALAARICADQDRIAALVQPQVAVIAHRIDELRQARKLVSAYGAA